MNTAFLMNETRRSRKPKRLHFAWLLFFSYIAIVIAFILEETFSWTNHYDGFESGLVQGGILGIVWCLIYVLPWGLFVIKFYQRRGYQKSPTFWMLAPSISILIFIMVCLIIDPTSPSKRFRDFAHAELPSDAKNLNYRLTGGGLIDYSDTYYFVTTPEEVDRLIADLQLTEDRSISIQTMPGMIVSPLPNSPDFTAWEGAKVFRGGDETQRWYYYLITDATRRQVYVKVGCT